MSARRTLVAIGILLGAARSGSSQPAADLAGARAAIDRWLALVRQGSADVSWTESSPAFQYRITDSEWREWVRRTAPELPAGPRREVEFTVGHDEPPLAPLTWVRAIVASNRPRGGRVVERVVVWLESDRWKVAHYGAWMDDQALVANGTVTPVPYHRIFEGQETFRDRYPWWVFRPLHPRPAPAPPRPEERPTNRANPRTFPTRPPTR